MLTLSHLRALIVDMDGVLYRGNTPIPGAAAFLSWLTERQFPFLLLTNNSTLDAEGYERKLGGMGIQVPAEQIVTSASATAEYLARNLGRGRRVFMIGEAGLQSALTAQGLVITDQDPEVVVVGMDRQLTYAKLCTAALAIRVGARFVATNPDRTLPTEIGEIPGAGAIVTAVAAATDRDPFVIGKPEPPMLEMALAKMGQPRGKTGLVGDRLETDILGGQRVGLPTILVLSGATKQAPAEGESLRPTWVFRDVQELHEAWQRSLRAG